MIFAWIGGLAASTFAPSSMIAVHTLKFFPKYASMYTRL